MKLSLKNIAKVEQGDIELNSISVIAGYNGTGKSTISRALYATLHVTRDLGEKVKAERLKSIKYVAERELHQYMNNIHSEAIGFKENIYKLIIGALDIDGSRVLTKNEIVESYNDSSRILLTTLNVEYLTELINHSIKVVKETEDGEYVDLITNREVQEIYHQQIKSLNTKEKGEICLFSENSKLAVQLLIEDGQIKSNLNKEFSGNVIYIEPIHVLEQTNKHFSIKQDGVKESEIYKLLKKEPSIVNEYVLEEYQEITQASRIADEIISDIIKAKLITVSESLFCKDNGTDEPINLDNVASGMKSLLMIQRLIKNGSLRRNDVLIIDEPEVNLHPKWQVAFAEILVLLNKKLGIRILLNSHSPYFIRAIECKMAQYNTLSTARFYLMREGEKYGYITRDVTENIEEIYSDLSEPLEEL